MSDSYKKAVGGLGEKAAVVYLKKQKYKILDTNYSTKYGEIDIICCNKEHIVFVEVKTRKKDSLVKGVYAVDWCKQQHIIKNAYLYLETNKVNKQPRFDIIEVEYSCDDYSVINHYIDAFTQGGEYAIF